MRGFWRWLARVLGLDGRVRAEDVAPSGLGYPSLDVEELLTELRVLERGAENGAANVPDSADTSPDGQEARIRLAILKRVETARTRASETVHRLEVAIKTRQLAPAVKRCSDIPESFQRELRREEARLESTLTSFRQTLADLEGEVEQYRNRHSLGRGPRIAEAEDRHNRLALLIVFALVQLVANAILFGQGHDYGLALGITFAAIFAFFDILLHFKVGEFACRVRAPDVLNRVAGVVALAVGAVTVPLVNLSMVHLRLVTRRLGVAGWEEWLPSVKSAPLGFNDFISWGLFAVGMLCSLLAVYAGFTWDEPVPLLRSNGRSIARLKEDLSDLLEQKRNMGGELLSRFLKELDDLDRQAETHVGIIADSVKRIEQILTEYRGYCSTAAATFDALVKSYRDSNRRHRTRPAPGFFNGRPEWDIHDEPITSVASLQDVMAQAERDHQELRRSLPRARAQLTHLGRADVVAAESQAS